MPSSWRDRVQGWSRGQFATFIICAVLLSIILLILDGITAARHLHFAAAVSGALSVIVFVACFRVIETRSRRQEKFR